MEKEIYLSRFRPRIDGGMTEIEKCLVKSIDIARDYVQKLGWRLLPSNESYENIEHLAIYDRSLPVSKNGQSKIENIERYIRY
jgi:hypothetical protein